MREKKQIREQLEERLKYLQEMGIDHLGVRTLGISGIEIGDDILIGERQARESHVLQVSIRPAAESHEKMSAADDGASRGKENSLLLSELRMNIGDCTRCRLSAGRKHIVFGSGSPQAELLFIGEAPGVDEDIQGLPFVGRAGHLLTKIINAIEMDREQVYIANIIKCRPPGNRNPLPDEIETCVPFLIRQIEIIKPRIIVALGTVAAQILLKTTLPITSLRGRFMKYCDVPVMPTFHPAFLLRNPNRKKEVWEDMKIVRDALKR
ncbi:MAG: uracil-DNA glycosylase [Acidobacteriota bacterium]